MTMRLSIMLMTWLANRLPQPTESDPATPKAEPETPTPPPEAAADLGGTQPQPTPAPANDEDDDYVPFFLTRGRWLRHIGLGKGTTLRFEWTGEQLIITPRYPPGFRTLHMPTTLEREVHYSQVQAYAHHPAPKGFTP